MAESHNDFTFSQYHNGSARRLALALTISLIAHAVLILGVRTVPPHPVTSHSAPIEAHLAPAVNKIKPVLSVPIPAEAKADITRKIEPAAIAPAISPIQSTEPPVDVPNQPALQIPLPEDPNYYSAKELDQQPVALQSIPPIYPVEAHEKNISGRVEVALLIEENGVVSNISIVKADPPGYFESAVLEAANNMRYKPAIKNGRAVKSRIVRVATFRIE